MKFRDTAHSVRRYLVTFSLRMRRNGNLLAPGQKIWLCHSLWWPQFPTI